jgi:hypothetical protein
MGLDLDVVSKESSAPKRCRHRDRHRRSKVSPQTKAPTPATPAGLRSSEAEIPSQRDGNKKYKSHRR